MSKFNTLAEHMASILPLLDCPYVATEATIAGDIEHRLAQRQAIADEHKRQAREQRRINREIKSWAAVNNKRLLAHAVRIKRNDYAKLLLEHGIVESMAGAMRIAVLKFP